ncbi:Ankyrin repeat protein [Plasmodiophora brassicae]|uniref:Ankyrin repeat protein n=1 Tax=Plasmodiophora brassicae TaxID=37360 RepID=A0A0G4IVD9_PLABS|nr:hypothetical protein PBRA_001204 [Plasmodiophora brassicae]SPQ97315.1 unnamed protein product [Plasmodiophora brassicae]
MACWGAVLAVGLLVGFTNAAKMRVSDKRDIGDLIRRVLQCQRPVLGSVHPLHKSSTATSSELTLLHVIASILHRRLPELVSEYQEPYTSSALHNYYFQTGELLRLLCADGNDRVPHDIVDAQGNTALNSFINVFATGGYRFRPECFATMLRDQMRILDYLVSGADGNFINIQNERGRAPLHSLIGYWQDTATGCGMAALDCSLGTLGSIVSDMIRAGASTEVQDGNGDTALHLIARAAVSAFRGSGSREDEEAHKQMWVEKLIRPMVAAIRIQNNWEERPVDLVDDVPGLETIRDALDPRRYGY